MLLCGEGTVPIIEPNIREGLCIPLAHAIEDGGGEVRRRAKVAQVQTGDGRVTRVVLADGSEIDASLVAIATGNPRIPALLDPVPPEVVPAIEYLDSVDMQDFNQFHLLREPVAKPRVGPDGKPQKEPAASFSEQVRAAKAARDPLLDCSQEIDHAADSRTDDRLPARHRFEERQRRSLIARGQQDDIQRGEDLIGILHPGKQHTIAKP